MNRSRQVVKADAAERVFGRQTGRQDSEPEFLISSEQLDWAIVDSGIDARHPAFRARREPSADEPFPTRIRQAFDLSRVPSVHADRRKGMDATHELAEAVEASFVAPPASANDQHYRMPPNEHGTHVAGILAGDFNSAGAVYRGICPDINLWDFRIYDQDGETSKESRVLMALRYIRHVNGQGRQLRICGVNLSLSLEYDVANDACGWTPVCIEVQRLVRSGVVVVAAAGNTGWTLGADTMSQGRGFADVSISDPGNAEEAITVGSTHREHPHRHGTSYFSSRGPTADGRHKPDLLAPGHGIWSAIPCSAQEPDAVGALPGTSQAAPHVSGAAALLMARNAELIGHPETIKQVLMRTATDLGRDPDFQGAGLLDILRALQSV